MKEKIIEAYGRLAKDYEKHVDTQSGHNAYYERPAMMELLPTDMNQLSVLDAGCAAGWYTEQCIKKGAVVTAIDISPEMVEACKRRVGDRATVLACDLTDHLPFKDKEFDLIVSSLTLHYLDDWVPTFREFHRVLRPGGSLIFSVHHPFMDFIHFDRPDYFAHELLMEIWNKKESGPVEVTFYRRPLQEILNVTSAQFIINQIIEPKPSLDFKDIPEASDWYTKWFDRLATNPHFLIVKANKPQRA
ncbi:Methyltransferase domain-containing protein [Paenibacillus sp. UNCCL117]|uniref:class I SAM-dependent methyltransferase n=1 Tax=unclassified Paenibacillus TaxID=185978 RepID=UPI0008815449|nr:MULTISPECIES: class I SAM-dependent methyltransferase [unclassified Paenibacillus]SDC26787.1 Methyltransferase domain-containing protein [Paenibacillus sp. cl123]SFW20183.1 Methyltransferase domain-containing protein [Paenibacillus sp. UNCCL117]